MPNILDSTSFDTALQTAIDTVMLGGDAKEAVKEAQDTVSSIE